MTDLEKLRHACNAWQAQHDHAARTARDAGDALGDVGQRLADARSAQELLQHLAQQVERQAHQKLASVVTRCLQAVFDQSYGFRVDFVRARGKTEARLVLTKEGLELTDPANEAGGGVLDVASFALRLSCLMLRKPRPRPLLVLDEPLKWLDRGRRPAVAELIERLAEELSVQFVIVTHDPEFELGTVVRL